MEIEYYGANAISISTKKARLVVDDNLAGLGLKPVTKTGDIALFSEDHEEPAVETKLVIDVPGEYEVSDVSVQAVAARAHEEENGKKSSVIYKITAGDIRVAVVGNIFPELSDEQLETLGAIDVLVLPVGGGGTLSGAEALKVIKKIEPKLVVPTHYADKQVKYSSEQASAEDAARELALEAKPPLESLKLKPSDLSEITQLVILTRR